MNALAGASIEVESISFSYAIEAPIFDDASFHFEPASRSVLLGRSGCGKSTLLALIALLITPRSGEIRWDGSGTSGWSDRKRSLLRHQQIGFVFQDHMLDPLLTAVDNVALPLRLGAKRWSARGRRRAALDALETVGLADFVDASPSELSGGQNQRVAIARAIVARPRVLLIDEPTASLDAATSTQVFDLFDELNSSSGTTLITSTHDHAVLDHADSVYELDAAIRSSRP